MANGMKYKCLSVFFLPCARPYSASVFTSTCLGFFPTLFQLLTSPSSFFDVIFQSADSSPAADTEKLENISCLTPCLSRRYNHHGGTEEEVVVVVRKEAGWREEEKKLQKERKKGERERKRIERCRSINGMRNGMEAEGEDDN